MPKAEIFAGDRTAGEKIAADTPSGRSNLSPGQRTDERA